MCEKPLDAQGSVVGLIFQSGPGLGSRYAKRSATLAETLVEQGARVVALCFGQLDSVVRQRLETVCERLSEEMMPPMPYAAVLAQPLQGAQTLVFDGPDLGDYSALAHKERFPITVVDDNKEQPVLDANTVINPNIHADLFGYQYLTESELYLGPRHALIRKEIRELTPHSKVTNPEALLVNFGDGDEIGLTLAVAKELETLNLDVDCVFVLNPQHLGREELDAIVQRSGGRFEVADSATAQVWQRCDLALVDAGSALYDAAYLGVPTVVAITSQTQFLGAQRASGAGLTVTVEGRDISYSTEILSVLRSFMDDETQRESVREVGRNLVDGLGAQRCADAVIRTLRLDHGQ